MPVWPDPLGGTTAVSSQILRDETAPVPPLPEWTNAYLVPPATQALVAIVL